MLDLIRINLRPQEPEGLRQLRDGRSTNVTMSSSTSSHPANAPQRTSSSARVHPVALPSKLASKYTGPVTGTAVLDEATLPVEVAAEIFEMVTPENTPLVKTHVKERFEAAAAEEVDLRRISPALTAAATPPLTDRSGSPALSPAVAPINTFDFFPTPDLAFDSFHNSKTHHRRKVLKEGGYFIFSDSYLTAHPTSCITGVTNELHMAAPESETTTHSRPTGPDAEKQRAQEVKDYIREAEHEYRPIFRRRRSGMVYGRAEYVRSLNTVVPQLCEDDASACPTVFSLDVASVQEEVEDVTSMKRENVTTVEALGDVVVEQL